MFLVEDAENCLQRPALSEPLCQHKVVQATCCHSSRDFPCPSSDDLRYTMTRVTVDGINVYLVEAGSALSLQVSVRPSVRPSVRTSVRPYVRPSVHPSSFPSIFLSIRLPVCLSICQSTVCHTLVCVSQCVFIHAFVCPSTCLHLFVYLLDSFSVFLC